MKHHILKLKEEFWEDVFEGRKTFEVRVNDRGYQNGDTISFILPDDPTTFAQGLFEITYVLNGWGIKEDWVVFSIKKLEEK